MGKLKKQGNFDSQEKYNCMKAMRIHHCDWLFPLSVRKASSENHSIDKSTQKKGFTPRACMGDGGSGP